jgi:hypothetical protein
MHTNETTDPQPEDLIIHSGPYGEAYLGLVIRDDHHFISHRVGVFDTYAEYEFPNRKVFTDRD